MYAFRGSTEREAKHAFRIQGLAPGKQYRLHFEDGSSLDRMEGAEEPSATGLVVQLPHPNASELIFFEEAEKL